MKVPVRYDDPERLVVDAIEALIQDDVDAGIVTVGVGLPSDWTFGQSKPHVELSWDTTPWRIDSVAMRAAVHVIVHGSTLAQAKNLALRLWGLCQGDVVADGLDDLYPSTNPLTDRDPRTHAELASFYVEACLLAQPVTPGS